MQISVNGEDRTVEQGQTVDDLLTILGIQRRFLAVERNEIIIPREDYLSTQLQEGDRLEIVTLVGGG